MSDETEKHCMCGCIYLETDCPNCNKVTDANRIEELERNILAVERRLKQLARWLDLSNEELNNLTIGSIVNDHRKMQADVNAAIAALKGEDDRWRTN
jgi:predicted  nucleic acid-binding Zn-ribbon protein